jgi:hypothetical protein
LVVDLGPATKQTWKLTGVTISMSQGTLSSEVNKSLCEAVGCFAEATTEIKVKVGEQGTISLRLCNDCLNKFD